MKLNIYLDLTAVGVTVLHGGTVTALGLFSDL